MVRPNELRRQAAEAVRSRRWEKAAELYERICEKDPSNGTPRNELGDLYLKMSDSASALDCFAQAAKLYRDFGLTNNTVAVLKKILRHDSNNLDSLWTLGEVRLEQGIEAEASSWFMEFLTRADRVPERARPEFVGRGLDLIKMMSDDMDILSQLQDIFMTWGLLEETGRVLIAKALQAHLEGEVEVRDRYIDHAKDACDHLESLPDYGRYYKLVEGEAASAPADDAPMITDDDDSEFSDSVFDTPEVELDEEVDFSGVGEALEHGDELEKQSDLEADVMDLADGGEQFDDEEELDLGFDFDADALSGAVETIASAESFKDLPEPTHESPIEMEVDAVGYDEAIGIDDSSSGETESEPIADVDSGKHDDEADSLELVQTFPKTDESAVDPEIAEIGNANLDAHGQPILSSNDSQETCDDGSEEEQNDSRDEILVADEAPEAFEDESTRTVDLLDEILADSDFDVTEDQQRQVDTIASEMQGQIANSVADDDYAGQYEMGIVYMDMGLYEQAIGAFEVAEGGVDERIRAIEMKGTCLLHLERAPEAMGVFQDGLAIPGYSSESYLGLLYGVGVCHEFAGEVDEARDYLQRVATVDAKFLDVAERLERLQHQH